MPSAAAIRPRGTLTARSPSGVVIVRSRLAAALASDRHERTDQRRGYHWH
jgi:hypothetical protein